MAHAVKVTGIEKTNTSIQSSMDSGDAFGFVCRAVKVGHPHAAQPKGGDCRSAITERA
jgi:hypothetical protein